MNTVKKLKVTKWKQIILTRGKVENSGPSHSKTDNIRVQETMPVIFKMIWRQDKKSPEQFKEWSTARLKKNLWIRFCMGQYTGVIEAWPTPML
uniref:Uncharacterized protein n=1 Tax=Romanomermis culicivorax TaxID=13658 RepID=A0A915HV73_ROMCU